MTKLESLIEDLTKAAKRLGEALDLDVTDISRDATIRRFEFTFELSWKAIQAYLKDQGLDCRSPKNCFRLGADSELIDNPTDWFAFLEARNLAVHTYKEEIAKEVYEKAREFYPVIKNLLIALKSE